MITEILQNDMTFQEFIVGISAFGIIYGFLMAFIVTGMLYKNNEIENEWNDEDEGN